MSKFDGRCSDPHKDYMNNRAAPAPQAEGIVEKRAKEIQESMRRGAAPAETARREPDMCSCEVTHAAHTFGDRPMRYCPGIPEWKKCQQCGRENSPETWERFGGKCPNCGDLHDRETAGEMTAEQFYDTLPEETKYKWVNKVRPHWAFDFANAFAKQRVEQAERPHHKWPAIRSKSVGEELVKLRAKVADLERERDNEIAKKNDWRRLAESNQATATEALALVEKQRIRTAGDARSARPSEVEKSHLCAY